VPFFKHRWARGIAFLDWQTCLLVVCKAHVVDSSPLELQLKKERQSFSIKQTFPNSSKKQEAIVITKV
jgi:hypothetical protein